MTKDGALIALSFLSLAGAIGVLLLTVVVLIRHYFVVCTVENVSMSPALEPGDRVLVGRHWLVKWVRRGHIVLVWPTLPPSGRLTLTGVIPHIKRVVGIGGDTLIFPLQDEGEQDQPYQNEQASPHCQKTWHIPPDHIFVCGDNRPASLDSRIWGPLPLHCVLGVALMKLPRRAYPLPPSHSLFPEKIPACGLPIGQAAPPFVAQTLSQENVALATYSGQGVVFIFIEPSSHYEATVLRCTALAPKAAKAGVLMVFVFDAEAEPTRAFVKQLSIQLPILIAPHKSNPFLRDYHISGMPAYCVINQQGQVQASGFLNIERDGWRSLVASWNESGVF